MRISPFRRLRALLPAALLCAALPLSSTPKALAAPTPRPAGELRLAPDREAVQDSWIVVLHEGATRAVSREVAASVHGEVGYRYDAALKGFSVRTSRAEATALAADPRVAFVEQDAVLRIAAEPATRPVGAPTPVLLPEGADETVQHGAPRHLDRIDQRDLPLSGTYEYEGEDTAGRGAGAGVTVYVIDTGIRTTHREFSGRAAWGWTYPGGAAQDCSGHGTHVAGLVAGATYGVAKKASLVAVKAADCEGSATVSTVIAAVNWVSANAVRPAVANISMGGPYSRSLNAAVAATVRYGIPTSVAAGNSAKNACGSSPASAPGALTVGATYVGWLLPNQVDVRSGFSNTGSCVDLFAPGSSIASAWSAADGATAVMSGTSMAAPQVAGTLALHLSADPRTTPAQATNALLVNATTGRIDLHLGFGAPTSPNRLLYSRLSPAEPFGAPLPARTPTTKN